MLPGEERKDESRHGGKNRMLNDTRDEENMVIVFDKASMMERLMDDEELAQTVIEGFLEDIPEQIEVLKGYLDAGDVPGAERQAHTIRGAAANVSGEALREVAFEMEKVGKAGDLNAVGERVADLEMQFERLKKAMERDVLGSKATL